MEREQVGMPTIVETGCVRSAEDWPGAGNSTYLFGAFIDGLGGKLISVDNDPHHLAFARSYCEPWPVTFVECDSIAWLCRNDEVIDVLYLDSLDIEDACHGEHALAEIQAAGATLSEESLVVFDDTWWAGDWLGKGTLAVPYLLERGWKVLSAGYQVVLSRKPATGSPGHSNAARRRRSLGTR